MSDSNTLEQHYPRPLSGAAVDQLPPALIPARATLTGRYVELVPQDARKHARNLYAASHNSEAGLRIWDYLAYGPWSDESAFADNMRLQSADLWVRKTY